jgi:hypothetical protein
MNASRPATALTPRRTTGRGWAEGSGHGWKGRPLSAAYARRLWRLGHAGGCQSLSAPLADACEVTPGARRHGLRAQAPWCASDTSPGVGTWPPPIKPTSEIVWCGARHGRVMTHAMRSSVRPATPCVCVMSIAAPRVIAGKMVVRRGASLDVPAPGGPMSRTLWTYRPGQFQLDHSL